MKSSFDIAVLPGDGIGREVMDACVELLAAVEKVAGGPRLALSTHAAGALQVRFGLLDQGLVVMRYVDKAKKTQPATWQGLHQPEPRATIKALWDQAEKTLAASCGLPDSVA